MQIDPALSVLPPRYTDPRLRKWMGQQIAAADEASMLALWLWNEEGWFLLQAHDAFTEHLDRVRKVLQEAQSRAWKGTYGMGPSYGPTPAGFEDTCAARAREFVEELRAEERAASEAASEATQLRQRIRRLFGFDVSDFYGREPRAPKWAPELEHIAGLYFALPSAQERLARIIANDRDAVHELVLREQCRREHLDGPRVTNEGRYLRAVYTALRAHQEQVTRDVEAAAKARQTTFKCPAGGSIPPERKSDLDSATAKLAAALTELQPMACSAVEQCTEVWADVESVFRLVPGDDALPPAGDPTMVEGVAKLSARLSSAQAQYKAAMAEYRETVHEIARLEDLRITLRRSGRNIPLHGLRTIQPREFERLVSRTLQRDGFSIVQAQGGPGDLGADVIALSPGGSRVVVQCKHTSKGGNVGTGALQSFNGTAVPEHQADVAVVVTNGFYTKPALHFAGAHGIRLLGGWEVQRWIEWGVPITELWC